MIGISYNNTISLFYGSKNRHRLATLSQLDKCARNKFVSRGEYKCRYQCISAFHYIILYILFSSFIKNVDSSSISRGILAASPLGMNANLAPGPLELKENIAKQTKGETFLAPYKDVEKGKISEGIKPSVDPYTAKLLKSLATTTRNFDKGYLDAEKKSEHIKSKMPFANGLKYDNRTKSFEISEEKVASIGGVIQSVLDAETELRYKHRDNVRIEYKIQTYVTTETAKVIDALQNKNIRALRENYPLIYAKLIEPLRTVLAVKNFAKDQLHIMESFNKDWYESAKPQAKLRLVTKIDQLVKNVPTYRASNSVFTKAARTRAFLKSKYTSELINLETEIRAQKVIREYMQGAKVLRHYTNFTSMYLAPNYNELVPALGAPWLDHLFDRYYLATQHASESQLAENLPLLTTRFLSLIEQNAITITDDDFQKAIYGFSLAVDTVMREKKKNKYKIPKIQYYGFMGMCNDKCEDRLMSELDGTLSKKSNRVVRYLKRKFGSKRTFVSTGLKLIRWATTNHKLELMMIESFAERVVIQLILRTNNIDAAQIAKYRASTRKAVKLDIDVKNGDRPLKGRQFLERSFKRMMIGAKNKAKRVLNPNKIKKVVRHVERGYHATTNYLKRTPLVKWMLSGITKLNKMRKRGDVYVCYSFVNVLKPSLGLDSNILSTHSFIRDLIEVGEGNEALSNWYNHTMQTWIHISSAHSSLHGFDPQLDKDVHMSKSLGALFRWLSSTDTRNSLVFTNKDKTVLASLSLQIAFFMDNSVRLYKKGTLGKFLIRIKNIFKMGRTSGVPGNWDAINDALEPKAVVTRAKFVNGSDAILSLVRMFEDRFIIKPSMPARLVQLLVVFIGMWTKNQHSVLDLSSKQIEPGRKHFYASLLSNKGIPHESARIILEHCKVKSRRKALHLGCINKVNGANVKCKPIRIRLNKSSLLKVIQELHGTLDDPFDMLRMAADLAKRCMAHNTQRAVHVPLKNKFLGKLKKKLYGTEEYTGAALLASEFSQRLHCYNLQKKVAKRLARRLMGVHDIEKVKEVFNKVMHDYQSMEIKMKSQNDYGAHKLMCQFMDANNPELVKTFKSRILKYGIEHSGIVVRSGLSESDVETIISSDIKTLNEYAKEIHNYHSYILVGTRFFNSITYRGGYPPNHIFESQKQPKGNGRSRSVFNGNGFVDELEELKITDPVTNITVEAVPGDRNYRRFYHLTTGEKLDEYDYAMRASNFVVTGSVLTTSRALAENGYDSGMIIWCGYRYGWVADFALRDVIHDINAVPLFNGRNWVLSTETRIKDFIGASESNTYGISNDDLNRKVEDVNVVYKFKDGASVDTRAKKTSEGLKDVFVKDDGLDNVQGNQPPVFSTAAADYLPGGMEGLVKGSEYQQDTNTLVIDLNSPSNIVQSNGQDVNFVRFGTPPSVNTESENNDRAG